MDAKKAVHKHEANMHPGKTPTKFAKGGKTVLSNAQLARTPHAPPSERRGMRRALKHNVCQFS